MHQIIHTKLNVYETAILRILIKRNQHPITIHSLIEGFPDGSEVNVVSAISHLKELEYVSILSGFPKEEEYVIYNLEMKEKILKMIDPMMMTLVNEKGRKMRKVRDNIIHDNYNSNSNNNSILYNRKKIKDNNRIQNQKKHLRPISIIMSVIFLLSFSLITNVNAQSNAMYTVVDVHGHINHYKICQHKHHQISNTETLHTKLLKVEEDITYPLVTVQSIKTV